MPELPEVEATRKNLEKWVRGRSITRVLSDRRHRGVSHDAVLSLHGVQLGEVDRTGKYLLVEMRDHLLVTHLGMSGRLLRRETASYVSEPHHHVCFWLDDNSVLVFEDHRRFGRVFLSPRDRSGLPPLGPDPLKTALSGQDLIRLLGHRPTTLKAALMDQSIIAGLGNIYSCETLWGGGLAPRRLCSSLREVDFDRLALALTSIITHAVDAGGATLDDYRGTNGEMGDFDRRFEVYGRAGSPCSAAHQRSRSSG